jgi:hypothetical protein
VARFGCPYFELDEMAREEWGTIGSAAEVPQYLAELQKVTGVESHRLSQMETRKPGGHAHTTAIFVMQSVADMPGIRGVSKRFHVAVMLADRWEMGRSDRAFSRRKAPHGRSGCPRWPRAGANRKR